MDITSDVLHSTMYKVCKAAGAPKYVIDSVPMDKEAADKLPDALFADRVNRRYPIDSKASTWLSAAYFAKTAEEDGYATKTMKDFVEATIKLAADKYGIRKDVDEAMEKIRAKPVEKKAEDDESNYGWPSEKKYPMFDEHGVKMANDYFAENAYNYPAPMRKEIAKRIFQKSAEYDIEANDVVRRESGNGFNFREDAAVELLDRVRAATNHGTREQVKMAMALGDSVKALMNVPVAKYPEMMDKFAEILDHFDEAMGFDNKYGVRFRSPMEIFRGRSMKVAEAIQKDTVQLGPYHFSVTKLASLPLQVFTDSLGDDFGESVKTAEAIDTQKLGPALKALPDFSRNALYRAISIHMA